MLPLFPTASEPKPPARRTAEHEASTADSDTPHGWPIRLRHTLCVFIVRNNHLFRLEPRRDLTGLRLIRSISSSSANEL
jgi:hypothetical protein